MTTFDAGTPTDPSLYRLAMLVPYGLATDPGFRDGLSDYLARQAQEYLTAVAHRQAVRELTWMRTITYTRSGLDGLAPGRAVPADAEFAIYTCTYETVPIQD